MFVVEAEDGEDSTALDADGKGVGSDFVDFREGADAHEALGNDEMASRADGKVFGDAFDEAEDEGLPDFHGIRFSGQMLEAESAESKTGNRIFKTRLPWELAVE